MANTEIVTTMNPQVRAGLTHAGTAVGGAVAALLWLQGHTADIQAFITQANEVVVQVTKLIALAAPFVTMAISMWNSRPSKKAADLVATGKVEGIIVNDPAMAAQLGPKVQTSVEALPIAAQLATPASAEQKNPT